MTDNKTTNTARVLYRNVLLALGALPIICMFLIAGSMFLLMLYVLFGFVVTAIS